MHGYLRCKMLDRGAVWMLTEKNNYILNSIFFKLV